MGEIPLIIFGGDWRQVIEHVQRCRLVRGEFIGLTSLSDMHKVQGIRGKPDSIPVAVVGTFGDKPEHRDMMTIAKALGMKGIRYYNPKAA